MTGECVRLTTMSALKNFIDIAQFLVTYASSIVLRDNRSKSALDYVDACNAKLLKCLCGFQACHD